MDDVLTRGDRLIPLAEVKARVGFGHTAIYRKMAANQFPRARSIGPRSVRWLESEINDWISNRPPTGRNQAEGPG